MYELKERVDIQICHQRNRAQFFQVDFLMEENCSKKKNGLTYLSLSLSLSLSLFLSLSLSPSLSSLSLPLSSLSLSLLHQILAGSRHKLLPLDAGLFKKKPKGFTCFRKAIFGVSFLVFYIYFFIIQSVLMACLLTKSVLKTCSASIELVQHKDSAVSRFYCITQSFTTLKLDHESSILRQLNFDWADIYRGELPPIIVDALFRKRSSIHLQRPTWKCFLFCFSQQFVCFVFFASRPRQFIFPILT